MPIPRIVDPYGSILSITKVIVDMAILVFADPIEKRYGL